MKHNITGIYVTYESQGNAAVPPLQFWACVVVPSDPSAAIASPVLLIAQDPLQVWDVRCRQSEEASKASEIILLLRLSLLPESVELGEFCVRRHPGQGELEPPECLAQHPVGIRSQQLHNQEIVWVFVGCLTVSYLIRMRSLALAAPLGTRSLSLIASSSSFFRRGIVALRPPNESSKSCKLKEVTDKAGRRENFALHAVYFIRDTVEFLLVLSLKNFPNLTSFVSYPVS